MPETTKERSLDRQVTSEGKTDSKTPPYRPDNDTKEVLNHIRTRYQQMDKFRDSLGLITRLNKYDRIYDPSVIAKKIVSINNSDLKNIEEDQDERSTRKKKAIAYSKIQTVIAMLIDQNPRIVLKSFFKQDEAIEEEVKQAYNWNWDVNRLQKQLRLLTFNTAKYGIAYGRRYYKRIPRIIKIQGQGGDGYEKKLIYDPDDVIMENIDPRRVLTDEYTTSIQQDGREVILETVMDFDQFKDEFPVDLWPMAKFVQPGLWTPSAADDTAGNDFTSGAYRLIEKNKVQVLLYQNKPRDLYLYVANGVLLTAPDNMLPYKHKKIDLFSTKWSERKGDSIDGIGLCELLEQSAPLVDELSSATIDQVRLRVKPWMILGRGMQISDEGDDEPGIGHRIYVDGDINQMKWDQPPGITSGDIKIQDMLREEIDEITGVPRDLQGLSEADTAFQAAQNIANSRKRLKTPLANIEEALEDDARLAVPTIQQIYRHPKDIYIIEDEEEMNQAKVALERNPDDPRFVIMQDGSIVRRLFRMAQLNLDRKEITDVDGNGVEITLDKLVPSEKPSFWEFVPSGHDWDGIINIVPQSFLPTSHELEVQQARDDLELFTGIQSVDEMGQPTLLDENGQPYRVNKVRLLKMYAKLRGADPDEIIVPIEDQQAAAPMAPEGNTGVNPNAPAQSNPLTNPGRINVRTAPGNLPTLARELT